MKIQSYARIFSGFLSLPLLAGSITNLVKFSSLNLDLKLRAITGLFIASILLMTIYFLGKIGHRFEKPILRLNQLLLITAISFFGWICTMTYENAFIFIFAVLCPALNIFALTKEEIVRKYVAIGTSITLVGFMAIAIIRNPGQESGRSFQALNAGLTTFFGIMILGAVILGVMTFFYMKKNGLANKKKSDLISLIEREGDLAFGNGGSLDECPYTTNPISEKAWKVGYENALKRRAKSNLGK